jgi:L-2-hydroxyglutarate oxidase LhgO
MTTSIDIAIIGAGVVGSAIAYELSKKGSLEICLIDKNPHIPGENQSSRNSGVIHAGIYYPKDKGPLKVQFCVQGNALMYEFCSHHKISCRKTGKLVVATNTLEEEYLMDVLRIAVENSVPGVKLISHSQIKEIEPNVEGIMALYVPSSGIVDASTLVEKLAYLSEQQGVFLLPGTEVIDIKAKANSVVLTTKCGNNHETIEARLLINAAGLYSDVIAKLINPESPYEMAPIKGEAAKFYMTKRDNLLMHGMNVYPVPYGYLADGSRLEVPFSEFKTLFEQGKITKSVGVHLSPTFDANGNISSTVTVGPAYSSVKSKEDYTESRELSYYVSMVKSFFPHLLESDLELHQVGIRAQLKDKYDFVIEKDKKYPHCINLVGIDSPGLTSSLAIAEYVTKLIS